MIAEVTWPKTSDFHGDFAAGGDFDCALTTRRCARCKGIPGAHRAENLAGVTPDNLHHHAPTCATGSPSNYAYAPQLDLICTDIGR